MKKIKKLKNKISIPFDPVEKKRERERESRSRKNQHTQDIQGMALPRDLRVWGQGGEGDALWLVGKQ